MRQFFKITPLLRASTPLRRLPYICPRCRTSPSNPKNYSTQNARPSPFRIAVIGSGPAGFYTAHRILQKLPTAKIDMYEQLPVPYGLVRYGVAPDHPEVKNCQTTFTHVAQNPNFTYIGNTPIGPLLPLKSLVPHYHTLLFAYGCSTDRRLNIPGESLTNVLSAREFVGWYNGLPQFADLAPDLESGEEAVIIGQGNVALDVARILLTGVDKLKSTDITEYALDALSRSRIKKVHVVGRRGPMQASFTVKEVRELMNIPSVSFSPVDPSFYPAEITTLPRVQKRIAQVLTKGSSTPTSSASKQWSLKFLLSPQTINASPASPSKVSSITFTHTRFPETTDPHSRTASVHPTEKTTTLPATLAFRSVGYKSTPLPGLEDISIPFDTSLGIIPNDAHGRIIHPSSNNLTATHIPGMYCAGWVKRGPTGVIASTMEDAFASAEVIVRDWEEGVPFLEGEGMRAWEGVRDEVLKRGGRPVMWEDWEVIDRAERERGRELGKEREKFGSVGEMLRVLDG